MTTVKEVKLMKDGKMVTPVVLADSIRNLDGSSYKSSIQATLNNKEDKIPISGTTLEYALSDSNKNIKLNLPELEVGELKKLKVSNISVNNQITTSSSYTGTTTDLNLYAPSNGSYLMLACGGQISDPKNSGQYLSFEKSGNSDFYSGNGIIGKVPSVFFSKYAITNISANLCFVYMRVS